MEGKKQDIFKGGGVKRGRKEGAGQRGKERRVRGITFRHFPDGESTILYLILLGPDVFHIQNVGVLRKLQRLSSPQCHLLGNRESQAEEEANAQAEEEKRKEDAEVQVSCWLVQPWKPQEQK